MLRDWERDFLETPIGILDVDVRAHEKVTEHYGFYVRDLEGVTDEKLLEIKGFGKSQLASLKQALNAHYIYLRGRYEAEWNRQNDIANSSKKKSTESVV